MIISAGAGFHLAVQEDRRVLVVLVVLVVVGLAVAIARDRWIQVAHGHRRPALSFRARVRLGMWPGPGWATGWSVQREHGLSTARRIARHARPSLSRRALWFGPWQEYATFLGWAAGRRRVYAHLESLVLVIAAPQEGKSQAAAGAILDAPGPVVATSIRGDLLGPTAALRAQCGTVHVWAPEGVGEFGSTMRVNIVAGCEVIDTAVRRAGAMVEGQPTGGMGPGGRDDNYWDVQAAQVLAAYLHAAALAGGDIRHVYGWIAATDPMPTRILASHPDASPAARQVTEQYAALPDRTRAGILTTLANVLRFMTLPACVEAVTTDDGGAGFDFAEFVKSADTLYLVASDGAQTPVTPLFLLLCDELAHVARAVGSAAWPGRLDPPLRMVLDELANTAPVPVARWSSWAAGSGIQLHLIAQAWAQLVERYGQHGADTIWQCCKVKMIYGGTSEMDLCDMVERLCGTAPVRVPEYRRPAAERPAGPFWMQGSGSGDRWRREEVTLLPAAELRQLPRACAVVISDHGRPVIVRTEQVRKRADVRRARRAGLRVDLPAPAVRYAPDADPGLLGGSGRRGWPEAEPGWPAAAERAGASRPVATDPARPGAGPADELSERRRMAAARRDSLDAPAPPTATATATASPIPPTAPAPWDQHRRPSSGGGNQ